MRRTYPFVALAALSLIIGAAAILFAAAQTRAVQASVRSSCGFWSLIGTLDPVTSAAPRPSQAAVTLVVSSRNAYIGQDCTPALLPPGKHLLEWAARYHLKVK